jgi:RNA polymerase sigma factor (sigma-70 family)
MVNGQLDNVVRHLQRLAESRGGEELSDGQLLERFALRGEEGAFAALVHRHGPMVLGVCRRLLRHTPDAEDAFQATFLVLFRRARALDRARSLASYLYTVAYHVSLKAKAAAARRRRCEKEVRDMPRPQRHPDELWNDLQPVLDEELNRLPDHYRAAVVVCYLEGKTNQEAGRLLGCPTGTVKSRLARARDLLRTRLARRGVALSAGLFAALLAERAAAAVPAALVRATIRTTVLAAAGQALAPAAALAEGVLKAMFVTRLKIATALLLAFGALLVAAGVWAHQARGERPRDEIARTDVAAAQEEGEPASPAAPAKAGDAKTMTVSGRVVDPDGKPLAGAVVAVTARQGLFLCSWEGWAAYRNEVLGQGVSDGDGRFRLEVPRTDPNMTVRNLRAVATAEACGLGWKALDPNAEQAEVELRLSAAQPVRGRLVGIQGEPVAGVTVHVVRVTRKPGTGEREDDAALRPPEALKLTATTDDKGEFVLRGFGPDVKLEMEIRDPRYERKDEWFVNPGDKKEAENLHLVLAPGRCVEGRVVYEDTGKPVPHARLLFANPIVESRTDDQGRFKVCLYLPRNDTIGDPNDIGVHAFPHPGEPYLNTFVGINFPKGVVRREVEVKLPRGVLVRGKVTEAGSGKPVSGAYIGHNGVREVHAVSGPDGSYQLGVPANSGHLLVTHPSNEFIPQVIGSAGGGFGKPITDIKPIGEPAYYHAVVPVDVKAGDKEKEANVTLRRGVTVKGRLVLPDDKPVPHAVLFVSAHRPPAEKTMHPIDLRDGTFEVRGLDPEKTYRLLFLDHPHRVNPLMTVESLESFGQLWLNPLLGPENKHGAVVEIVAKKVEAEMTVKLAPCGKAKVRFVDGAGKPLADYSPWLQLVVTQGPPIHKALEEKVLAAEVITLIGRYGGGHNGDLTTDAQGNVTFEGLIPGATYRLKKTKVEPNNEVIKEFTVEAGKTTELEVEVK